MIRLDRNASAVSTKPDIGFRPDLALAHPVWLCQTNWSHDQCLFKREWEQPGLQARHPQANGMNTTTISCWSPMSYYSSTDAVLWQVSVTQRNLNCAIMAKVTRRNTNTSDQMFFSPWEYWACYISLRVLLSAIPGKFDHFCCQRIDHGRILASCSTNTDDWPYSGMQLPLTQNEMTASPYSEKRDGAIPGLEHHCSRPEWSGARWNATSLFSVL